MVARSARTESANAENIKLTKVFETDLVECVGNAITCEVCARYRGRVFSVSGKRKDYPPLRDGPDSPLKNGYDLIHPNCRCEFRPYFEELHTKEENESMRKYSNRPFEDSRTDRQAKAYQSWQAKNRQINNEILRYKEMQTTLGKDMQYANIGSLRRALRADENSLAYKKSHYAIRDYQQFQRWKGVLGEKNMPSNLAEFQELKYNKSGQFDALSKNIRDEKVRAEIKNDFPLKIQEDKQGKHIEGHKNYIPGKSKILLSLQECQKTIDKYATKGQFIYDKSLQWQHKERIETNQTIGIVRIGDKETLTKNAIIHYSKNGAHIVPKGDKNET